MNDKETVAAASAIAAAADRFKNDIDKDKTLPKPEKDAAKKDVELLIKHSDAVKSRASDGKPATAELRQLTEQAAKLQTFVGAHSLPAPDELANRANLARQAAAGLWSDTAIWARAKEDTMKITSMLTRVSRGVGRPAGRGDGRLMLWSAGSASGRGDGHAGPAAAPPHPATRSRRTTHFRKPYGSTIDNPFTGDLDALVARRAIRVAVTFNRTHYFIDKGQERGVTYESLKSFENDLNTDLKTGNLKVNVVILRMSRDQMYPALASGEGGHGRRHGDRSA